MVLRCSLPLHKTLHKTKTLRKTLNTLTPSHLSFQLLIGGRVSHPPSYLSPVDFTLIKGGKVKLLTCVVYQRYIQTEIQPMYKTPVFDPNLCLQSISLTPRFFTKVRNGLQSHSHHVVLHLTNAIRIDFTLYVLYTLHRSCHCHGGLEK